MNLDKYQWKKVMNYRKQKNLPHGFALVESLIALVICSIGLIGVLQSIANITHSLSESKKRYLAQLSAQNSINEILIDASKQNSFKNTNDCSQANYVMKCNLIVSRTRHPNFIKIVVYVFDKEDLLLLKETAFKGIRF